jgi:hypothetical protein
LFALLREFLLYSLRFNPERDKPQVDSTNSPTPGRSLMPQLTRQRAVEIIRAMRDRKIVVLGDVMLDEFFGGDVTRISPEAPVPVVDIRRESVHLGGAANVLANAIALGANACVVGVIGNDTAGERLSASLREASF